MDREQPRARACRPDRNQADGPDRGKVFRRADDWPFDRFAVVERAWPGSTVVCIAGGQIDDNEITAVHAWRERGLGRRVIAVNDAYLRAPWADVHYHADARWWGWHYQRPEFQALTMPMLTIEGSEGCSDTPKAAHAARNAAIEAGRVGWLHHLGWQGITFSLRPNGLATGMNSGYQVINLAYLLGAAVGVLLGYSLRPLADGRMHWFGDHPTRTPVGIFSAMRNEFAVLARSLPPEFEVINATRDTALDCFPKRSLESLLLDQDAAALPA